MKNCVIFIMFIALTFPSQSQSLKEKTERCDLSCAAQTMGVLALPATAVFGFKKLSDEFGIAEKEIYTGLPDQPMTQSEISQTIRRMNEQKTFEKSKFILVNNTHLNSIDYSSEEVESKLSDYARNNKGVHRIAIKNPRIVRGGSLIVGIGTMFLFQFVYAGEAEETALLDNAPPSNPFERQKWARPVTKVPIP